MKVIELEKKCATGRAHGKLILFGEHSVVYGKPAIAMPFTSLEVVAEVEQRSGPIMISCGFYEGPLWDVPLKLSGIAECIWKTLKHLNKPLGGLLIQIRSTIPIGRGLGSSAAIAIAIVKGLYAFFGNQAHPKEVLPLVNIAEKFAHGNPSGIDMITALSDIPIWFKKGERIESIQINVPLFLVIADSGRFGDTHAAVLSVKNDYIKHPIRTQRSLNQLEYITREAREALFNGDMNRLGLLLDFAHDELVALGVSDQQINRLVKAARKAGALGAKLTGGGRGGCILALAQNHTNAKAIAASLTNAGAENTWVLPL